MTGGDSQPQFWNTMEAINRVVDGERLAIQVLDLLPDHRVERLAAGNHLLVFGAKQNRMNIFRPGEMISINEAGSIITT